MLSCGGIFLALIGLLVIWLSRDSEGCLTRTLPILLGLLLLAGGLYLALFETGEGLARFLPEIVP